LLNTFIRISTQQNKQMENLKNVIVDEKRDIDNLKQRINLIERLYENLMKFKQMTKNNN